MTDEHLNTLEGRISDLERRVKVTEDNFKMLIQGLHKDFGKVHNRLDKLDKLENIHDRLEEIVNLLKASK